MKLILLTSVSLTALLTGCSVPTAPEEQAALRNYFTAPVMQIGRAHV